MAKWEDKDPKWIVQDRQDGSNVNGVIPIACSLTGRPPQSRPLHELLIGHPAGWHWEEKNQLGWSKQKLEELLVGLLVDMSAAQGEAKVTALKDLKGEVRPGPAFVLVMRGTAYHTQYIIQYDFFLNHHVHMPKCCACRTILLLVLLRVVLLAVCLHCIQSSISAQQMCFVWRLHHHVGLAGIADHEEGQEAVCNVRFDSHSDLAGIVG
jgi:hypothetical protein